MVNGFNFALLKSECKINKNLDLGTKKCPTLKIFKKHKQAMKNYLKKTLFIILVIINCLSGVYAQNDGYSVKTICIDAGHGGKDPGALGKISKEKDICLSIALKLGNYIKENIPGVDVIYTREKDVFVELGKRPDFANENKADLFISIHINSCNSKSTYGSSTYVVGEGRKDDNLNLALTLQENGGEFNKDDIDPLEIITLTKLREEHKKQSVKFASLIQSQFKNRAGRKDLGVKEANFAVLWRAQMPAVLIECGFISNANEEKYMATDEGQCIYASAIYRAVKEYKKAYEKGGNDDLVKIDAPKNTGSNVSKTDKPKQQTKPDNQEQSKAPSTKTADNNIYYKVQLKSSTEKISTTSKVFKGIGNIEEQKIGGVYKYTVGKSQDLKTITNLQNEVRKKIPDAFVIAIQGDKRIDIATAKKLLEGK